MLCDYDLFISYARADNRQGRVTELKERIEADYCAFTGGEGELRCFFDKDDIQGMDDWRHRILQGLRQSRLLLVCLSPAYLQSNYCQWEFNEYLKNEIGRAYFGDGVAPVYFVEIPGWEDQGFEQQCADWVAELRRRQHFDLRPWFHAGEAALRDTVIQDRMAQLNKKLRERLQRHERAAAGLGNVDTHNLHFIGRISEMRRLREIIALGRVGVLTAVHGLGGVGKTALAVEYAHTFAHEYGGGRWQVRCEGQEDLRAVLASLRGARGFDFEFTDDEKPDLVRQFERVLRELQKLADARAPHRCLLILDNVDRPKLLEPAQTQRLPSGEWLHVLATTRLGGHELFGSHQDRAFLPVDELPEADALELLESYQPNSAFTNAAERAAALEIVRLLGCFTLAVESAAVYLGRFAEEGVTCEGFLYRLQKEGLEGLDTAVAGSGEGVLHGEMRLSATLGPTLERLEEAEKLALSYAALLPPDQVPLPWLRSLVAETFAAMEQDAEPGYADPWKNLLGRLFSLRLLHQTGVMDDQGQVLVVRVHRLVQELMRRGLTTSALEALQQFIQALIQQRDAVLENTTQWTQARWEVEPLDALASLWADRNHAWAAWLLNQVGQRWHHLGEWTRAEPLMRRALAIDEASFGPQHPNVAITLNNLAQLLQATNRLPEAEPLMRRALDIDEESYGQEHPKVAIHLNNLAGLLQATNRLPEAEPLMRRALAIDEESFGPQHPNVAIRLNNLAQLLQASNRLQEAEPLMRRALAIDEASFGPEHLDVARDLNNLAALLQDTNRLEEAEPLMRRVIAICEKSLGSEHPKVATSLNNLAALLQATNHLPEAESLMRRALAIDEESYGPQHPDVARDLNNLAQLLQATNRLLEAKPLMRRALAIDEQSFGPQHPMVAIRLNNLAQLLQATNRLVEAEPLMRRMLEIFFQFTRATGHPHPHLQAAVDNYSGLLEEMGLSEAEILARLRELAPEFFAGPQG